MTTKQKAIEELTQARELLKSALIIIKMENVDGQFDYCTDSNLSYVTDEIEVLAQQIEKIVYQK